VKAWGASLKATEQPIDTSTAAGKCFLDMLGVFAEFETNLRKERQLEGIADAKPRVSIEAVKRPSILGRSRPSRRRAWGRQPSPKLSKSVVHPSTAP
jgi:DNA invertase Pin-like site-specific DNA recombinase